PTYMPIDSQYDYFFIKNFSVVAIKKKRGGRVGRYTGAVMCSASSALTRAACRAGSLWAGEPVDPRPPPAPVDADALDEQHRRAPAAGPVGQPAAAVLDRGSVVFGGPHVSGLRPGRVR